MVAVKIQVDFGPRDVGHAALVVEILIIVGEIGLPEVRLGVVNDQLQLFLRRVVEQSLNLFGDFRHLVIYILSQCPPCGIIIHIVLLRPEILPVEVLMLNPVFPKADLRTIVELCLQKRGHTQDYQT